MNLKKIEDKLNDYFLKDNLTGLSLGIYKAGEENFMNIGSLNNTGGITVTADTLYEIGSITKTITAAVLSILQERNVIDLHSPIKTYLADTYILNCCFDHVTSYRLLTHTSGLPRLPDEFISIMEANEEDPYTCISKEHVILFLELGEFNSLQKKYDYSNLGFGILGFLVEHILKKDFYSIAKELVLEPLQMNNTTVAGLNDESKTSFGYNFSGRPTPFWENKALAACGCLISSTNDMMKFLKANIISDYSKVSKDLIKTHASDETKTGLAWHYPGWIEKLTGRGSFIWHNGMTGGCSSYIAFSKKYQSGFILLTNKQVVLDAYCYYLTGHLK